MVNAQLSGAPSRADHPTDSDPNTDELLLQAATSPIIGWRIMREDEIAPAWFSTGKEVGETVGASVANEFCRQQNEITMNPNRSVRIMFYADPIFAEPATDDGPRPTDPTPRPTLAAQIARLERSLTIQTEGLAEALVKVNDSSLSEMDQAGLEASIYFTRRDIAGLHEQINELRDEQKVAA